jgi:hypothetical protein
MCLFFILPQTILHENQKYIQPAGDIFTKSK